MSPVRSDVLVGSLPEGDPCLELAFAHALVRRASAGELDQTLRVYTPATPMVVFGRRDARLPGFDSAVRVCRSAGFAPAIRATGGRPVAYTQDSVVVDLVRRDDRATEDHEVRFLTIGRELADLLVDLGVDARLGAVPGEYCPGAHSVNARGTVKLVGTAQRVVRGAWLFSALIVVGGSDQLRPVLDAVYEALGLPLDPDSVGSVRDEARGVDRLIVQRAVLDRFGDRAPVEPTLRDTGSLLLARELLNQHRVP
jgi:octanoyl-[GcvH]:protein N-octanoyltransferase